MNSLRVFLLAAAIATLLAPASSSTSLAQSNQGSFLDSFDEVDTILSDNSIKYETDPVAFIGSVLKVILSIVGVIAAAVLVYGGLVYITSLGDEQKTSRAKAIILYAVIGLLVIGVSAIIVNLVINIYSN